MTDYVIDATVAIKWFLPEMDDTLCLALLDGETRLFAPSLLAVQVGHALSRRQKTGQVGVEAARRTMRCLTRLPIHWTSDADLAESALAVTQASTRSYHEAIYLALAARIDAPLVSADRRWCEMMQHGPLKKWVRFVGELD